MTLTGIIKDISAPWLLFPAFSSDIDCWFNLNLGQNPSFFSGLSTGTDPWSPEEEQQRGDRGWVIVPALSREGAAQGGQGPTWGALKNQELRGNCSKMHPGGGQGGIFRGEVSCSGFSPLSLYIFQLLL